MVAGSMLAELSADLVAIAPSSVGDSFLRAPPKAPKGVRFAATMKMFDMMNCSFVMGGGGGNRNFWAIDNNGHHCP